MMREFFSSSGTDRVLVTMEAAELDGYGVSFSAMSLGDPPTRAMLRDLLAMVDIVPPLSEDWLMSLLQTLLTLLTALGVVIDPTTEGAADSDRAMNY